MGWTVTNPCRLPSMSPDAARAPTLNRRLLLIVAALAPGITTVAACDGMGRDEAVVMADSAGIALVRNRRPARDTVRLTAPVIRIGHDEAKTESIFRQVDDVAFTTAGSIVAIDGGAR